LGHIMYLNETKNYRYENFDIHEFYKVASNKYILPAIAMSIFYDLDSRSHVLRDLNIRIDKLQNYIIDISGKYVNTNHFHNALHAADVGQTVYSLLYNNEALSDRLSKLDQFTLLLSAFVHDVGHNGTNNEFLVKTMAPLAVRYNDQSVLENFHISIALATITSKDKNNFLERLTIEHKQQFRKVLIKAILATDNSKHFEKIAKMNDASFSGINNDTNCPIKPFNNKDFVMEILLHAADISNPAKRFQIYGLWVDRIMEEFYALGDMEHNHGLVVTEIFKRDTSRAKVQLSYNIS